MPDNVINFIEKKKPRLFYRTVKPPVFNDVVSGFLLVCLIYEVTTWGNQPGSVQNWIKRSRFCFASTES